MDAVDASPWTRYWEWSSQDLVARREWPPIDDRHQYARNGTPVYRGEYVINRGDWLVAAIETTNNSFTIKGQLSRTHLDVYMSRLRRRFD